MNVKSILGHYTSDLAESPLTLTTTNQTFKERLTRQKKLAHKIGARFEADPKNFFEAGFQHRQTFELLDRVIFNVGTPSQQICTDTSQQSISGCASTVTSVLNDVPILRHRTTHQNGLYWTTMFTVPLPWNLKYSFDSTGNYFIPRSATVETSAETHYAIQINNGIKLPIWHTVALEPHAGWFVFENQLQHATLTRTVLDLRLTYNFNKQSGVTWFDALKGKKPSDDQ